MSVGLSLSSTKMKVIVKAMIPPPAPNPPTASKNARGIQPASTMSARNGVPNPPKPKKKSNRSGSAPVSGRLTRRSFFRAFSACRAHRAVDGRLGLGVREAADRVAVALIDEVGEVVAVGDPA